MEKEANCHVQVIWVTNEKTRKISCRCCGEYNESTWTSHDSQNPKLVSSYNSVVLSLAYIKFQGARLVSFRGLKVWFHPPRMIRDATLCLVSCTLIQYI
jgi:hypothetical protein